MFFKSLEINLVLKLGLTFTVKLGCCISNSQVITVLTFIQGRTVQINK